MGTVHIFCAGGLENGGGIGRQMGYFLATDAASGGRVHYRVIDPRGPWYLGDSLLYLVCAAVYFARAVISLLVSRASSNPYLAHVNISGRGSTIRKLSLVIIARALRLRYVLHVHEPDYARYYLGRSILLKKLIATAFERAAAILVLGQRDCELISRLFRVPSEQIVVLPNAVPNPLLDFDKSSRGGTICHFLFLGRLSPRKGVPELLLALGSPPLVHQNWRATLAGDGPLEEYRNVAKEVGILDRVSFPGWIDETSVRRLCAAADILVLPSHGEGLAMSVLEGLSYGLPVVTTPVGAHPEVIEPDVSGIFIPPGDVGALAAALARLVEDNSLRERLSRGARDRFLDAFNIADYATRLVKIHADMLAIGRSAAEPIVGERTP
jgi:glycosyltransferase involved in cell wall biosynthesis